MVCSLWRTIILDSIYKLIISSKSCIWCISKRTIFINANGTIRRTTYWCKCGVYDLSITLRVIIIIQNIASNRCIYFTIISIIVCNRNISIVWYHCDGHRGGIAQCRRTVVADGILEGILALEPWVRGIGIAAIGGNRYRTVHWVGITCYQDLVSIWIKIIYQYISRNRSINFSRVGIIICNWWIILNNWVVYHFNCNCSRIACNRVSSVAHLVLEAVLPDEVSRRGIGIAAVRVEHQRTVRWAAAGH